MAETVRVDPPNCTIIAKGQHMHMHAKVQGKVIFKSHFACKLKFNTVYPNKRVFREDDLPLQKDVDASLDVIIKPGETGRTEMTIENCQYALDLSDPTDIIVP